MGDVLTTVVDWVIALPAGWVYALILAVAYLENVVPPIPGDMLVVFGGYMAGSGLLDPYAVVFLASVGGFAGFMTMYMAGARIGHAIMDPDRFRWIPKRRVEAVRRHLARWGFGLVAANRFLSGLRSVISLTVGMAHMNVAGTALWSAVSSIVWTGLLVAGGFFLGENWTEVSGMLQTYGWALSGVVIVFIVIQILRYRRRM